MTDKKDNFSIFEFEPHHTAMPIKSGSFKLNGAEIKGLRGYTIDATYNGVTEVTLKLLAHINFDPNTVKSN